MRKTICCDEICLSAFSRTLSFWRALSLINDANRGLLLLLLWLLMLPPSSLNRWRPLMGRLLFPSSSDDANAH